MPRTQTAPSKSATAETAPAKTSKAEKTEKVKKAPKTATQVEASPATVENVTVPAEAGDSTSQLESAFALFHTQLQEHAAASAKLRAEFRALEKAAIREVAMPRRLVLSVSGSLATVLPLAL